MKSGNKQSSKYRSKRKKIPRVIWLFATIISIFILWIAATALFSETPSNSCVKIPELSTETKIYKAHPIQVVVEPWLGEHHVYALFVLPKKYRYTPSDYEMVVTVKGSNVSVNPTLANPKLYKPVDVPEGYYLVVSHFWTRETIWLILQGKYRELQYPCNWTLYAKL